MPEISLSFFAGVLTTTLITAIIKRHKKNISARDAQIRQSSVFLFVKRFMPHVLEPAFEVESQAQVYESSKMLNYIEMPDNKVYWIDRNIVYYADSKNGRFDPTQGKLLKTKNIPAKEVDKVLYIINTLRNE